jgi:hypothetical protein
MQYEAEVHDIDSSKRFHEMEMERQHALIQAHHTFVKRSITKTILVALVVIGVTVILCL